MATGFNPSDEFGGVVVSGTGNVTATFLDGPAFQVVRGVTGHATGKWYFEATVTGAVPGNNSLAIGVAQSTYDITDIYGLIGGDTPAKTVGFYPFDVSNNPYNQEIAVGSVWGNSAFPASGLVSGDTISVCVDADNNAIYFIDPQYIAAFGANGWNGLITAAPQSNIGGITAVMDGSAVYIIAQHTADGGVTVTLNTGGSAFLRAPPSGFSAWDMWGTAQSGQGFASGAGLFTSSGVLRARASGAFAGTGSFAATTIQKQFASGSFAGAGAFDYLRNSFILVSQTSSIDTGVGTLAAQSATLASTAVSTDTGVGSLTIPTIQANTNLLSNNLVDALLRGQAFVIPATWYFALVTIVGNPGSPGTEVTGGSYARQAFASSLVNWSGTQGAGTTTASTGTSGILTNNVAITFPAPTADWGTVVGYELWDALTGGNRWLSGAFPPLTVSNGGPARAFAIGALSVSIG